MARSIVAIAERVDELPASIEAFRRGELSLDQMATIARNAPAWADVQSRDYAIVMTVTQLRQVLQKYPFPAARRRRPRTFPMPTRAPGCIPTVSPGEANADTEAKKSPDSRNAVVG